MARSDPSPARSTHRGPLAGVAVSAATEDHDDLPLREVAQGCESGPQRGFGMREVDERDNVFGLSHDLEPSRQRLASGHTRPNRVVRDVQSLRTRDGGEQVLLIEAADQRALELDRPPRSRHDAAGTLKVRHDTLHRHRAASTEPEHAGKLRGESCAVRVFDVHRSSALVAEEIEEPPLGPEVGLEVAVVVEMILGEVGEDPQVVLPSFDAPLLQRV